MLDEQEKFTFEDQSGKNNVTAEINWNEEVTPCKSVRFKLGDKVAYIDRKELNTFLFAIGTPSEQRKMVPQKTRRNRHYETVLSIKATKNILKGEHIRVPVSLSLPSVEEEVIADVGKRLKRKGDGTDLEYKKGNKIIVPKNYKGKA